MQTDTKILQWHREIEREKEGERDKILVKCFKLRNFEDVKGSTSVIRKKSFFCECIKLT